MNRADAIRLLRGEVVQLTTLLKRQTPADNEYVMAAIAHAETVHDITKTSEPTAAVGVKEFQR